MPNATNLSFLGVAKEVTKGTGVAATGFIPMKTLEPLDQVQYLEDTGFRGAMVDVYNEIVGPAWSEFSGTGDVFPDTISWWLANIFGDLVESGASAPFTHNHAVKNSTDGQPGALSLTDFWGLTGGTPARRYPGMQVAELGFKFQGDGMFEYAVKCVGFQSALVAKPTQSFSTIVPQPGWLGAVTIGGSGKTFVEQGEINIKRNATPIHTVDGTQSPYAVWVGEMMVDGKMTIVVEDETELLRYLNSTTAALVFNWTSGAAATLVQVQCTMSKVQYTQVAIKRGKDFVEAEIEFKAIGNTTDVGASGGYGPCKFVVQNATAAGVYA